MVKCPNVHTPDSSTKYRPDIDGLRAIAVLLVVLYHAGIGHFSGGFIGVDVFFVISGFLITRLLLAEQLRKGKISFVDFYARRMKRLLPALVVVLLATVALNVLLVPGFVDVRKFAASIRWSAFGFANVFFKRNTGGYFDGTTEEMPLLHLWSLGVEEQFYLVWPLLLTLCLRMTFKSGDKRFSSLTRTGTVLSIINVVSFISACAVISRGGTSKAFYLMPYRAWELGMGGLLACLPDGVGFREAKSKLWGPIIAGLGLGFILVPSILYSPSTKFPGAAAFSPVLGTVALIWAGASFSENIVSSLLSFKPLVRIGLLSYGWYLWHWPLLVTERLWNLGLTPSLAERLCALGLSLLLAELSLRWVETPIRRGNLSPLRVPKFTVAGGLTVSALLCAASLNIGGLQDLVLSERLGSNIVRQLKEATHFEGHCFSQEEIGSDACSVAYDKVTPNNQQPSMLAIWGDSHACSYFSMLEKYGQEHGLRLTQYCQGQTPALVGSSNSEQVFQDLSRQIKTHSMKHVSVVLVSRWIAYTGRKLSPLERSDFPRFVNGMGSEEESLRELKKRLVETYSKLKSIGVFRVLVLLPYPEFKYPPIRCLMRSANDCQTDRATEDDFRNKVVQAIRESAAGLDSVHLIDPLAAVCDNSACPEVRDGMPVTIDTNHPSVSAARLIGNYYEPELDWVSGSGQF